ncbi:hypothetical protein N9Q58_02370 [Polaribacter sp.]|nr:hypothetical protein [Polaribacter sp.]
MLLGFPKQDAFGEPIPNKDANNHSIEKRLMSSIAIGEKGVCIGVNDSLWKLL